MKKEEIDAHQKAQQHLLMVSEKERMRGELDALMRQQKKEQEEKMRNNPEQAKRESQLITKITNIFRQRECSFYDAFQDYYDSLSDKNTLSIKIFKSFCSDSILW